MQISEKLVGKHVAVQFARPVYMFDYVAHVKDALGGDVGLLVSPKMRERVVGAVPEPSVLDFAICKVVEATDKYAVLQMFMPDDRDPRVGSYIHKQIDNAMILSCDYAIGTRAQAPQVTVFEHAATSGVTLK